MNSLAEFVGLPYRDHGRERDGVDCYGLVRLVLRELRGIELPIYSDEYANGDDIGGIAALVRAGLPRDWVPIERPEAFALVVFRGRPTHVGLCVDDGRFLHSDRPGVTSRVERLDSPLWAPRIEGYYRHAGH